MFIAIPILIVIERLMTDGTARCSLGRSVWPALSVKPRRSFHHFCGDSRFAEAYEQIDVIQAFTHSYRGTAPELTCATALLCNSQDSSKAKERWGQG